LQVATALRQIDQLDLELDPLERWLRAFAAASRAVGP
jgi:hypothetical protein